MDLLKDLKNLLEDLTEPACFLSAEFRYIWANTRYITHSGHKTEDLDGKNLCEVIPADYAPILIEKLKALTTENPYFDNEYPEIMMNGQIINRSWRNRAIFDNNGKVLAYCCIVQTSSPGEKAVVNLRDNDLILNSVLKSAVFGLMIAEKDKILFINDVFEQMLELSENKPDRERYSFAELLNSFFNTESPVINSLTEYSGSIKFEKEIAAKGKKRWVSVITKIQEYNNRIFTMMVSEDITVKKLYELELKRNRENLAHINRIAKLGYWEKDFSRDRWFWSEDTYRIFDVKYPDEVTEDIIKNKFHPDDYKKRLRNIETCINSTSDCSYEYEYRIFTGNGKIRWITGQSFFKTNSSEKKSKFFGWVQDQTDRKQNEEALKEALVKAEESERLKTAFLANISHEIRTPLNAILGFSDLISKTSDPDLQKTYSGIIRSSGNLLLTLVNDMIDFAKIEAGSFELFISDVYLEDLFHELRDMFMNQSGGAVRLQIAEAPDTKGLLLTDRDRLTQILVNLINNAFKYTEKGIISIEAEINHSAATVVISVSDTGIGINPSDLEHIFDRFYQINSFSQGTGLGLPISRAIAAQLGGSLTVESQPAQGSKFMLCLPFVTPSELMS